MVKISKIKIAAYIRISKREKENNSIYNQKDLIDYYIKNQVNMEIYDYYIDNGYRGTDFNRPELKRMLKDISNKKVDALIVKDLSKQQMIYRHNNEGGLYDIDNIIKSNEKIKNRNLLPNEIVIDVYGKSKEEVLNEAINIIDKYESLLDYEYEEPDKKIFYSWVLSDGLR